MREGQYNVDGTTVWVKFLSSYQGVDCYTTEIRGTRRRVSVGPGGIGVLCPCGRVDRQQRIEAVRRARLDEYASFLVWHCERKAAIGFGDPVPFAG